MAEILGTLVAGLAVAAAVLLSLRSMIKDRKNGKSSCGCGCSGCPNSSLCHAKQPTK